MTQGKSDKLLIAAVFTAVSLLVSLTAVAAGRSLAENAQFAVHQPPSAEVAMKFPIPDSLTEEHAELHTELELVIQSGGQTGEAAQAVAAVLHPHFVKEEKLVLPPLGLLA